MRKAFLIRLTPPLPAPAPFDWPTRAILATMFRKRVYTYMADKKTADRRVRKTIVAIRSALERLMQNEGLDQISVRQIADEADIGYTTFFRHYASKEEAILDLVDHEATILIDGTLPLVSEVDSRTACLSLCNYINGRKAVWSALLNGGAADRMKAAIVEHTNRHSADWPKTDYWLDDPEAITLIVGLTMETIAWWLGRTPDTPPERIAEIIDRLIVAQLL